MKDLGPAGPSKKRGSLFVVRPGRIADYLLALSACASILIYFFLPSVPGDLGAPLNGFADDDFMFVDYIYGRLRPFIYLLFVGSLGFKILLLAHSRKPSRTPEKSQRQTMLVGAAAAIVLGIAYVLLYHSQVITNGLANVAAASDSAAFQAWRLRQSPVNLLLLQQRCPTAELRIMSEKDQRRHLSKIGEILNAQPEPLKAMVLELYATAPGKSGENLRKSSLFHSVYVKDHALKCMKELGPPAWVLLGPLAQAFDESVNKYRGFTGAAFAPFSAKNIPALAKILDQNSDYQAQVSRTATEMLRASPPALAIDLISYLPQASLAVAKVIIDSIRDAGGDPRRARAVDAKLLMEVGAKSRPEVQLALLEFMALSSASGLIPVEFWLDILRGWPLFGNGKSATNSGKSDRIYELALTGLNGQSTQWNRATVLNTLTTWAEQRPMELRASNPVLIDLYLSTMARIGELNEKALNQLISLIPAADSQYQTHGRLDRINEKIASLLKRNKTTAARIIVGRINKFDPGGQAVLLPLLGMTGTGTREELDILKTKFHSKDSRLRDAAFRGLIVLTHQSPDAANILLEAFPGLDGRKQAEAAAATANYEAALKPLTRAFELSHPDFTIKFHAAYALARAIARSKQISSQKFLENALKYNDPYLRAAAAEALEKSSPALNSARMRETVPWVKVSMGG